ncbi:hypothetical protein [Brevibacillus laterosporus]|uniref:hypothetical protein n=1 Tax=Brevibacillus laterosporus TaxID=1465 RepID=UPI0018CF572B|nr:hypothetical protein [Brevibacillus laterosporus]MBG9788519.1 hypothetical protein [Brevibacillus laterosporus]
MNRNVEVGVLSYKIEQGTSEGKLLLELDFYNPSGNIQEYERFLNAFNSFLEEGGYTPPIIQALTSSSAN